MSEHKQSGIERYCDTAIIGGSAAGLAAALQLGRQRRGVIVIDSGEPRNAPAAIMHSYLGHEGIPPSELTAIAREEVRSYGGEILAGRAVDVTRDDGDRFRISLTGGNVILARRVLAATGLIDELPDIKGLAEHWGSDAIHCPFCHGYEVRDQRVVQIVTNPIGLHTAGLFRQLTDKLTLVLHEGVESDNDEVNALRAAGVAVIDTTVERVVADKTGGLEAVELSDGQRLEADAVVIASRFAIRTESFASLGVATVAHPSGLGDVVEVDATGETSVPGLYAAGNVTDPSQQVLQAAANGSWVAGMISHSLASEDIEAASRPSSTRDDWEQRYGGDQIWSGNPNGSLVQEVDSLSPGRALDVGAGEGGDAVWLAEQGWLVTATDIAKGALDSVDAVAQDRSLAIETLLADANASQPFEPAAFELVSLQYPSFPRTPDERGLRNIIEAVAPGGTLLVVGHDPEPMQTPVDIEQHTRMFDPAAFVGIDDFLAAIGNFPGWTVECHEKRKRPPGSATGSHHVDDIVFRAKRQA